MVLFSASSSDLEEDWPDGEPDFWGGGRGVLQADPAGGAELVGEPPGQAAHAAG